MKKENDYEEETKWIQEARQGDKEAMMRLLKKYEPLLRKLVAGETRLDWEDLLQDLTLAFLKGVKAYDSAKGVYFAYYIRRLLYWKKGDIIKTAAKRFRSEVHSLEGLEDIPDERVPLRMDPMEAVRKIADSLPFTPEDRKLLAAILRGDSWQTITSRTGMSRAAYYRARARLFASLRKEKDRFRDMVGIEGRR